MKYLRFLIVFIVFLLPNISSATLRINEIAWQGYLGDANNEWIEIYNDGSETINLDGWLLEAGDGTPSINLSGLSVSSGDFILLERTDDSTVPEETASKFYSGALSNEGENLLLKNSNGTIIDSADFSSGWGEMQSSSVGTMSRFGSSWSEGESTPKSQNISLETETGNSGEDENEGEDDDSENEEEITATKSSSSASQEKTKKITPKGIIEAGKQSFVGVPVFFESSLFDEDGDEIRKGIYVWNMGDGTVLYKTKKEDFSYTYQYPGEYVITLSFYKFTFGKDLSELDPYIYDEHIINISNYSLSLEEFKYDGTIVLKNNTPHTIELSLWQIEDGISIFMIPNHTFVRPGKTITFPGKNTRITTKDFMIRDTNESLVSLIKQEEQNIVSSQDVISVEISKNQNNTQEDIDASYKENQKNTELLSLVSHSQQKTMYVGLFVLLAILIVIIVWLLFSAKKDSREQNLDYEIIEE